MPEFFWKYRKTFTLILKTLIPVALGVFAIRVWRQDGYSDFIVYFQTSKRMLAGQWREIYQVSDHYAMFRYNPICLLLFWPFGLLPEVWARQLFFSLNLGAAILGVHLMARALFNNPRGKREQFSIWLACGLTVRFFLDSLWMGQVVGLMLGALGLYYWSITQTRAFSAAGALLVPSLLKVGFVLLAPLGLTRGPRFFGKMGACTLVICLLLGLPIFVWVGPETWQAMILGWKATLGTVLTPDSVLYWDSKDFRTQALNSALIRMASWGWFSVHVAYDLWRGLSALFLCFLGVIWLRTLWSYRKRIMPNRVIGLLLSLGVMTYLIFMPWSYRHTLSLLILPVLVLLASPGKISRAQTTFWICFTLLMSLGGTTFVGVRFAFWVQELSIPVIVMAWMTGMLLSELRREVQRNGVSRS